MRREAIIANELKAALYGRMGAFRSEGAQLICYEYFTDINPP
jgi:hypothetical protein